MKFTFYDHKPILERKVTPFLQRIITFLDRQKPGVLFDAHTVAAALNMSVIYLRDNNRYFLKNSCLVHARRRVYGSKETIVQLKKEMKKNGQPIGD